MSENETKETEVNEVAEVDTEAISTEESKEVVRPKTKLKLYLGSFLIVLVIILVILFQLEKEGRSSTNIFGSIIASQEAGRVVATVNSKDILNSELQVSIEQFTQMATAQGLDIANESIQAEIKNQSLEVMVNTELLKQEAVNTGIEVSDEDVTNRLQQIIGELGGEELLDERMLSLGISRDELQSDIREELLIQGLLDNEFAEAETLVTEEEVALVYEEASAGGTDLPALEEVRSQIEAQIIASKEQGIIDTLIADLREQSEINIVE